MSRSLGGAKLDRPLFRLGLFQSKNSHHILIGHCFTVSQLFSVTAVSVTGLQDYRTEVFVTQ